MERVAFASLVVAVLSFGSADAWAQNKERFELDQYRPAELVVDGFVIPRPVDLGHLQVDAQLHFDYALNPLVYESDLGDAGSESASIVEHQAVAQFGVAVGLIDRLVLFAGLPVNVIMEGDNTLSFVPSVGGFAVGDARFGARARLLGGADEPFALAVQLQATAPFAHAADDGQAFVGSRGFAFRPRVLAELQRPKFRVALDLGARLGKESVIDTLTIGHQLTFGLGAFVPVVDKVTAGLEIWGSTDFDRFFDRESSPLEALLGAKVDCGEGWFAGGGAGTGLTRGYGSPDLRLVLAVGHTTRFERPAPPPPEPVDTDGDGLLDDDDGCPTEPEDQDGFEDSDGCPDDDNDQDGVPDVTDRAPNDPEDRDSFEDEDGAPDPDNDGDGILDTNDRCPNEAEDADGIQDDDGCPETDADSDTVPDETDRCPLTPGLANHSNPDCLGCPALACTDTSGSIRILQRIEFETDSDVLRPVSEPVLQAVFEILSTNDQIRKVRVEGHTDDRGNDDHNLDLSQRRAASVVRWLVEHGVAADRLEPQGLGETRPLVPNRGAANRQTNRRVEFHITDPAPPAEVAAPEGGDAATPPPAGAPAPAAGGGQP